MRLRTRILIGALCALAAGCSQNLPPNVSPEGKVAIYARQALTMADGVLTEVDNVTERRLAGSTDQAEQERIKAQARAAIGVIREVGVQGQNLATALNAWHVARKAAEQQTAAARVRLIVQTVRDSIPKIVGAFPDPNIRATLTATLQALTTLLLNVEALVPAPAG